MPFLNKLHTVESDEHAWTLTEPLVYRGSHETFTVPSRFKTDLATVPRILWAIVPPWGKYSRAAVLHDWFYVRDIEISRRDADGIFRRAMKESGVGWLRRHTMWAAVRVFGWMYWR